MASNPVITVPILELWAKRVNDAITKEQWFPTYLPPCNSTFPVFLKQKTHSKQYGVMDVMHAVKNVLLLGLIACTAYRCGLLGHMSLVAWPNRLHVAHTDLPRKNGWTDRDAVGGWLMECIRLFRQPRFRHNWCFRRPWAEAIKCLYFLFLSAWFWKVPKMILRLS